VTTQYKNHGIRKLTKIEERFVLEYSITGNATQSYLMANPGSKVESARTLGSRLLRKVRVQVALNEIQEQENKESLQQGYISQSTEPKSLKTRDGLLNRLEGVIEKAEEATDSKGTPTGLGTAVKGISEYARIKGYSDPKEEGMTMYANFINRLIVFVQKENPPREYKPAIDWEKGYED